jgi:hypothetical protein
LRPHQYVIATSEKGGAPSEDERAQEPVPADRPGGDIGDTRDVGAAVEGHIGAAVERALERARGEAPPDKTREQPAQPKADVSLPD